MEDGYPFNMRDPVACFNSWPARRLRLFKRGASHLSWEQSSDQLSSYCLREIVREFSSLPSCEGIYLGQTLDVVAWMCRELPGWVKLTLSARIHTCQRINLKAWGVLRASLGVQLARKR